MTSESSRSPNEALQSTHSRSMNNQHEPRTYQSILRPVADIKLCEGLDTVKAMRPPSGGVNRTNESPAKRAIHETVMEIDFHPINTPDSSIGSPTRMPSSSGALHSEDSSTDFPFVLTSPQEPDTTATHVSHSPRRRLMPRRRIRWVTDSASYVPPSQGTQAMSPDQTIESASLNDASLDEQDIWELACVPKKYNPYSNETLIQWRSNASTNPFEHLPSPPTKGSQIPSYMPYNCESYVSPITIPSSQQTTDSLMSSSSLESVLCTNLNTNEFRLAISDLPPLLPSESSPNANCTSHVTSYHQHVPASTSPPPCRPKYSPAN